MQVFIACGIGNGEAEDPFRKPKPGMWRIMEKHFNSGISIDMDQLFHFLPCFYNSGLIWLFIIFNLLHVERIP